MRIIGGRHKGRRFHPPKKNPARPTTDIAKEGLFNIIENQSDISRMKILDLFGGTGSISFEFASRGAVEITTVERYKPNVEFIRTVSEKLDLPIRAVRMDVFKFIPAFGQQVDLIFAGPPYALKTLESIPGEIFAHDLLRADGWLVLEHDPSHDFSGHEKFRHQRNYGQTNFSIFIQN